MRLITSAIASRSAEKCGMRKDGDIMLQITVKIDGMMCGMCVAHVNDAIRKAFPVKKVSASHSKGQAVLLTETDISEEELCKAIDATGYRVLSVTKVPYEKKGLFSGLRK